MSTKILIAGEGGQGIQTITKVFAKAAQDANKKISYIPSFGVEQRGGISLAFLQYGDDPIAYPRFSKADILVIFCSRAIEPIKSYISENTLVIFDSSAIDEKHLSKIKPEIKNYLAIPAQQIAKEKYGIKSLNMILLGALSAYIKEIPYEAIEKQIIKELEAKIQQNPDIKNVNLGAVKEGINFTEKFNMANSELKGSDEPVITRKFEKENISWARFPEYCKGCTLCIVKCPVKALQLSQDLGFLGNPLPIVDINKCIGCKKCEDICPDGAIEVENKKLSTG